MIDFKKLKESRKEDFDRIQKQIDTVSKGGNTYNDKDTRYWAPSVDKMGNGYAVIRFLPAPAGEDTSFVRMFDHGFKGPTGKWYIANSLTTLGQKDPLAEYNSELWNSTDDDKSPEREQARAQKRRLSYISNIYVVEDPANPDNNGKVFLYKFGKKIWNKLQAAMYPEFKDESPMNPFDLWEGANFKLKIRQVDGYRNYDRSEFDKPSQLLPTDTKLEEVYNAEHSLQAEIGPDKFETYEALEKKLKDVLGPVSTTNKRSGTAEELPTQEYRPSARTKPATEQPQAEASLPSDDGAAQSGDDNLAFFENLAKD